MFFFRNLKEDPESVGIKMSETLLVALSTAICGAEDWQDVEDFGKIRPNDLRAY